MHFSIAKKLNVAAGVLAVLLMGVASVNAASIEWNDGDGGSGTLAGTWNNLQTAITSAEGGGAAGTVKVSGDLARSADDATVGDLLVAGGNLTISGGWDGTFTSQGAKSTLNVNGAWSGANNGYDANNTFRVMEINGAATTVDNFVVTGGRTEGVNGPPAIEATGAGIWVNTGGHNTTLQNLVVTDNMHSTQKYRPGPDGGGIAVTGASYTNRVLGVKISNVELSNNRAVSAGGGISLDNAGTQASPTVIENANIHHNSVTGTNYLNAGYGGGIGLQATYDNEWYVLIAKSTITQNTAAYGGGIANVANENASRVIVFGSLIADNDVNANASSSTNTSAGIYCQSAGRLYVANSTVADNVEDDDATSEGVFGYKSSWSGPGRTIFVNAIVADNQGLEVVAVTTGSGSNKHHMDFQNSTLDESRYKNLIEGGTSTIDPTFAAALVQAVTDFHSLDASGVVTQNIEQNLEGDPSFVGPGDYQLTGLSNSLNNGITQTGSYTYVDVNSNGSYDALMDVIVAGTPPAGDHFVYLTDLAGNPRVTGSEIDRGAYELVPEPATIALLGLGFAVIGVMRRRKR